MLLSFGVFCSLFPSEDIPLLRALPIFTVLSSRTVFCSPSEFVCAGGNVRGEGGRDRGFGLGDSGGALSTGLITFGDGIGVVARGFGGVGGGDFVLGDVGIKEEGGGAFVEVAKICFWRGEVCGDLVAGGGVRIGDLGVGGGTGAGAGAKESLIGGAVVGGGATGALGGDG